MKAAKTPTKAAPKPTRQLTKKGVAGIHYRVEIASHHAHLFKVTLTIAQPAVDQEVSLPVWIPGSYLVREFAKNLQHLRATQGNRPVALAQIDKCSWRATCSPAKPLVLTYEVYALDNSVRTAWLDSQRVFFNGTSLCLKVANQDNTPHTLELVAPTHTPNWRVATSLSPYSINTSGYGIYSAHDYDALVDCPVEMGNFWSASFIAGGVPHRFVVTGAADSFDADKLIQDTQAICETEIRFWHEAARDKPPFTSYLFMLNVVDDGYGGLEHRSSTALICTRKDLPQLSPRPFNAPAPRQSEGYATLLGLISHEYFHTWNVKRLHPAEFASFDYARENYTQLLWFFEGFTSYYDDLLLRRAGLIDDAHYLKLLTKTINQVLQAPGRQVQSVAQASFDAWVKYYRQDENTPNATISYYTKGSLVALCLDLTLRAEGKTTLDAVMRGLWKRCKAGPMAEADLLAELAHLAGRSFDSEIAQWVHSTNDLPVLALLEKFGVQALEEPAQIAQALGLRVSEQQGVHIKSVLRGGAAERAGFASGDEWLGIALAAKKSSASQWRIHKLHDLLLYLGKAKKFTALVARDKRLLELAVSLPAVSITLRLSQRDQALGARWLSG